MIPNQSQKWTLPLTPTIYLHAEEPAYALSTYGDAAKNIRLRLGIGSDDIACGNGKDFCSLLELFDDTLENLLERYTAEMDYRNLGIEFTPGPIEHLHAELVSDLLKYKLGMKRILERIDKAISEVPEPSKPEPI